MMSRAILAVAGAIAAIALVMSFRTPAQALPGPVAARQPDGTVTPTPTTGPPAPTPDPSSQSSSSTSTSTGLKDGSYTGQDAPNEYGDVQVQVVVSGGKITDIRALQLPSDRARSQYISQVAGPMLHDEAIQAQSAQIDTISGATFTSDSYAQSLQSALDEAR